MIDPLDEIKRSKKHKDALTQWNEYTDRVDSAKKEESESQSNHEGKIGSRHVKWLKGSKNTFETPFP